MGLFIVTTVARQSTYAHTRDDAARQADQALRSLLEIAALDERVQVHVTPYKPDAPTEGVVVRGAFEFVFLAEDVDDDPQTAMDRARKMIEALGGRALTREEADPPSLSADPPAARTCGLCGHSMTMDRCGSGMSDGVPLCHTDSHDCYHRWTLYGERPATPWGTGE